MARSLIAVVDDDESVRRSTRLLLESFGYQAAVFESAEGFLRFGPPARHPMSPPGRTHAGYGWTAASKSTSGQRLRHPVIFITAYDDQESRRQALQDGAIALLGKPFTDQQLFEAIRSALRHD